MPSIDNELRFPDSTQPHAIAKWFHDPENVGGFIFLCFVVTLVLIAVVSFIFGIYYFFNPYTPPPNPKSLWISIADYQDKLTPEQQDQYIQQACDLYEKEMKLHRLQKHEQESGVMFPNSIDKHRSLLSTIKHFFYPRHVIPLEKIHRDESPCYFFADDEASVEQVEKEANRACSPHNMV
ncbi:hypothetical protein KDRO_E06850 [Kluyveromyces lactis]|nr:hypothetical protein KDRO_E06850 [Kluyveromyces lactis]